MMLNGAVNIASKVTGLGVYVPDRKVTNEDALKLLEEHSAPYLNGEDFKKLLIKAEEKLVKAGSEIRYWCDENQYCTDIAKIAAQQAIEDAGIEAKDIDMIIFTGMSKAFVEPATAHVLRHELGATNANVIDTQDACTSFMKSLELADSLIKTGNYRTVLIAAGERTYDWADFTCKTVYELDWKFGSLTIGDAAGAMVVQATDEPAYTDDSKHMRFFYRLDDGSYATCHIGLNYRVGERYRLHSHSARLIRTGLKVMMELLVDILAQDQYKNIKYDNLFIHDIGKIIDEMVLPAIRAADVHVPDNYRSFFPEYGNVASASFPLSLWLARRDGRLQPGNRVIYVCPAAGVQAGIMIFRF